MKLRQKIFGIFVLLVSLLFVTQQAFAVVTIGNPTATVASSSDASTYAFASFTPAANAVEVVFVGVTASVGTPTMSDSGNSYSWTREASVTYSSTTTLYMFWAKTGASPNATVITFDCSGDPATGGNMVIFEASGADVATANPIKQFKTSTSASSTPSTTMDAAFTVTNGGVYAVGISRSSPALAPTVPWVEVADTGHASPNDGIEASSVVGETASAIATTGTAGANGMIVAEVYASGAGPAAPTSRGGTRLLMGV